MSIVFAVLLTLSLMAPSLNPEKWPIAILFSLFFQYFFIINFILAIYWLVRQRLYIILPLFPLVMGYNIFARSFNIIIKDEVETNRPKINLLTYNTRLFDLYNWSHNLETRAKMFNYIKDTKSDIICLQEFYTDDNPKSKFSNIDTLKQITGLKYETHHYTTTLHKTEHWGIVTYSRFPIINSGVFDFDGPNNNSCIFSDFIVRGDTFRVYNLHLESIRFAKNDYTFIDNIEKEKTENFNWRYAGTIAKKLMTASVARGKQAERIHQHILKCPYPILVCGDFNDTPASYTYSVISPYLKDAFHSGKIGFGATYNGPFPAFRIDQVLYSPYLKNLSYTIDKLPYSDHFPVRAVFQLP